MKWRTYYPTNLIWGKLPNGQPCSKYQPNFGLSKLWIILQLFPLMNLQELLQLPCLNICYVRVNEELEKLDKIHYLLV